MDTDVMGKNRGTGLLPGDAIEILEGRIWWRTFVHEVVGETLCYVDTKTAVNYLKGKTFAVKEMPLTSVRWKMDRAIKTVHEVKN